MIKKIISGGQTGADQGGLEAAWELGLLTGGTAPYNFMTEIGPEFDKLRHFGLSPGPYDPRTYPKRTELNVKNSDGTLILGNIWTPGSKLTRSLCQRLNKPYLEIPNIDTQLALVKMGDLFLKVWIEANKIEILNIAGNRESKNPGIQEKVKEFLVLALGSKK